MKKASKRKATRREPSASALKEMPEVDFSTASVRSNPYAKKLAKTGIEIVIPGKKTRRIHIQSGKGRPEKATETGGTSPKSVRFPDSIWHEIEKKAKARGISLHAALREAILEWLEKAA